MSLVPKHQVAILAIAGILAAFSLFSILNFTDPYRAGWLIFAFFYLSVFLLSFCSLALLAFGLKRWLWPKIYLTDLAASTRQGLLLSVFLTLSVALQMNGILHWWIEFTLILFFVTLEIFINLKK